METIEQSALNANGGWESLFEGASRQRLETSSLVDFLPKQRWFAGKSRRIKTTRILDWSMLKDSPAALVFVQVQFDGGPSEEYLMPLSMIFGEGADELQQNSPNAIVAPLISGTEFGFLHDGLLQDSTCQAILSFVEKEGELKTRLGTIRGIRGKSFENILGHPALPLPVRRSSAEQSNTSILYGDRFILKALRRQELGLNPDAEIGEYLTEKAKFDRVPPFAGFIEYESQADAETQTLAILQGFVANEGDGWAWTTDELSRYFENCARLPFPQDLQQNLRDAMDLSQQPPDRKARDHVGMYLDSATTLGRRTAEMHLALASAVNEPAFTPEPIADADLKALFSDLRQRGSRVFDVLKERVPFLPDDAVEIAAAVLSRRTRLLDYFDVRRQDAFQGCKIRIHGDYHLGQVLRVKTDFVILDFEGEPARPLNERRAKQYALKDVAGMLRSFSYAVYSTLINYTSRHPESFASLEPWARLWEHCVAGEFLRAYREGARDAPFLPANVADFREMLQVFLIDKALYEVLYELNARPAWIRIPLMGIMSVRL